eukprot:GHVU01097352.1.p1 GENE.GHVU01097352.1~~GHVU01097352.1.p1  ORF type:complete len:340 (-),score=41.31 GHVU01097352.1:1040-1957(-)
MWATTVAACSATPTSPRSKQILDHHKSSVVKRLSEGLPPFPTLSSSAAVPDSSSSSTVVPPPSARSTRHTDDDDSESEVLHLDAHEGIDNRLFPQNEFGTPLLGDPTQNSGGDDLSMETIWGTSVPVSGSQNLDYNFPAPDPIRQPPQSTRHTSSLPSSPSLFGAATAAAAAAAGVAAAATVSLGGRPPASPSTAARVHQRSQSSSNRPPSSGSSSSSTGPSSSSSGPSSSSTGPSASPAGPSSSSAGTPPASVISRGDVWRATVVDDLMARLEKSESSITRYHVVRVRAPVHGLHSAQQTLYGV